MPPRLAEEQGAFQWRPLVFVTLAVVAGGVLLTRFGLVPAVIGATFIGALSERRPRWLRVLAVSIVLVGSPGSCSSTRCTSGCRW